MRFLSLSRPWSWSIFDIAEADDPKRIENRTWPCPTHLLGKPIALHDALGWDQRGVSMPRSFGLSPPMTRMDHPAGLVVGVVTVERVGTRPGDFDPLQRRWYMGNESGLNDDLRVVYGWVLRDVMKLPRPIAMKGAQGLRSLPTAIAIDIIDQLGLEAA